MKQEKKIVALMGGLPRVELFDSAGKIADTATVFQHMTGRSYTEQELEYLLKFQNPLEIVTKHWKEVRNEAEDKTVVQGAVKREHGRRQEMPKGYFAVQLQSLDEQQIQAEREVMNQRHFG